MSFVSFGVVVLLPNTRVRRARYVRWRLTWDSYRRVVGEGAPRRPVRVQVQVLSSATRRRQPRDPRAARPQGGFEHVTHRARILRRVR